MMEHPAPGRWIRIPAEKYDEPHEIGLQFETFDLVSPYDIPQAVRSTYDSHSGRISVEFRYMVDEEVRWESVGEYVRARLGKNSGRVLGFEVDLGRLAAELPHQHIAFSGPPDPFPAIDAAFGNMFARGSMPRFQWGNVQNFHVARQILADRHQEVFEGLSEKDQG